MKKKILLLLIIIILTGCQVNADISINYDYTVDEKINVLFDNELASNFNSPKEYAKSYLEYYNPVIKLKDYNYDIEEKKDKSSVIFTKKSKNICDSINYGLFIIYLYDSIKCTENEYYMEIKSVGTQSVSAPSNEKKFNVESLKLKVKLPISAEENNADEVKDNVYSWYYDENSLRSKNLYLKVDKTKLEENRKNMEEKIKNDKRNDKILTILCFLLPIIIIGIISVILFKKYKSNKIEY